MINSLEASQRSGLEIAIVGVAGRFPGAKNIEHFWQNLKDGVESISFYNDKSLIEFGVDKALLSHPQYVKAGAILEDVELFDAAFFGFNPREAEIIDPQHRLFLECAWEALENAGYSTEKPQGVIGVYAGTSANSYLYNLYTNSDIQNIDNYQLFLASDKDFLTTRVSYKLNLEGPSVNIQTSCSTSLVAIHIACQSLLGGECDIALAGGVSVSKEVGYLYQEGGIYSPDGHCRAFDAKAQGTVGGSGLGIVVLKTLEDALNDGDCIHAVIKGSAINNDGAFKVSYTAPRIDSQARAIRAAQIMAEVEPESITYIEAHGTGTPLGDPIEITALTQAFRVSTQKKNFCAIGSIKTNIGHLDATAGIASLIKTVLALKHKQIPPSLHFKEPNPQIDFANSPFYVNTTLSEWQSTPRRAGVSSFGIGGTNAHVILEEAPAIEPSGSSRLWQLLLLSAKTDSALDTATANLAAHLQNHELNLADVAYTLQVGRRTFDYRRMVVCQNLEDAVNALETLEPERISTQFQSGNQSVAFMFPGQETQIVNIGWELYQVEPTFRKQVDLCCELLKSYLDPDLRHVLYPEQEVAAAIEQPHIALPALFAIEYALAQLFISWGIRPVAMLGQNVGEYVAACLAGVFSLEDALRLVTAYGRLMQPAQFIEEVKKVKLNPPQIPLVSNLTGTWMTAAEATSPTYWAAPRQTARLALGIAELTKPNSILLSLGPGHILSTFAKQHLDLAAQQLVCALPERKEQSDVACLLSSLGKLWLAGVEIDWHGFYEHERRYRIPLPTYPFERQRCWIDPQPQLQIKSDIADWFYVPSWERNPLQAPLQEELAQSCWLVFVDECGVGSQITQRLEKAASHAIAVTVGEQFSKIGDRAFTINPQQRDDYDALLQALAEQDLTPSQVVHMWGITMPSSQSGISEFEKYQARGFYSLLFLVQALAKQNITTLQIMVVTNNVHDVIGEEELIPDKVTVLGLCKVIPQEYPGITCRSIDVVLSNQKERLIDQLFNELIATETNLVVAYRGQHRWLQNFKTVYLDEAVKEMRLRAGKTYLVVGELVEGMGIVLAEYLAQTAHNKLVLIGASFPERDEWQEWLATHEELEKAGTEFLFVKADVTNTDQMQAAINQAYERFGQIHAVFYSTPMSNEKSAALIQQLNTNQCEWNFKTKVHGLYVLAEVLQGRQIDFYFLQSSLSCVLGGLGLAAYSAANLFIDAFANQQNQTSSATWFSVNWDAVRSEEEKQSGFGASLADLAMSPQEIWNASRRILAMNSPGQVIVSKGSLQARIDEWIEQVSTQKLEDSDSQGASSLHSRPELPNEYVAPRNEIEQIVANIWQELLGIDQLGVYDDFFELGGHSLLAVQMISRLRETFQVELPMRSILFDAHNVAGLASIITKNQPKQEELQEIAELLEEVKNLSPEEIQQQLAVDH